MFYVTSKTTRTTAEQRNEFSCVSLLVLRKSRHALLVSHGENRIFLTECALGTCVNEPIMIGTGKQRFIQIDLEEKQYFQVVSQSYSDAENEHVATLIARRYHFADNRKQKEN